MSDKSSFVELTKEQKKFFPERLEDEYKPKWYKRFMFEDTDKSKTKCEKNVIECIYKYPLVKIMLDSLEKNGCKVNLKRHFSCEYCSKGVGGGYDARKNQIIICYNRNFSEKSLMTTISHELLHMWDYCTTEFDYKNMEHFACTEIRAANLFHCSLLESLHNGSIPIYNIKNQHRNCVKEKAIKTLEASGHVNLVESTKIVNKIFNKCYSDLEPLGKRFVKTMEEQKRCYQEKTSFES